jgi:hypothetical protein
MDDHARFGGGIEPVGVEAHDAEARAAAAKRIGEQPAMLFRQIEIIGRARDVEIGIGVVAIDEADALVPQIAFHLEIGIEAEADLLARLQAAAEFLVSARLRTDR